MMIIKSYTDINQSKKLAEILPFESADMAYYQWKNDGHLMSPVPFVLDGMEEKEDGMFNYIPCWSLSVLLNLIPNWTMDKTDKVNLTCNPYYHCESCYAEPLDAAFEMIVWLKENNKL